MKTRLRMVILVISLMQSTWLSAEEDSDKISIVQTEKSIEQIQIVALDSEQFEIGAYMGFLSVEDFNTNSVQGVSFAYYFAEKWMIQANYGTSDTRRPNYEADTNNFVADREFAYKGISFGYEVFPGRSFFSGARAFNSAVYLMLGLAAVDFINETNVGTMLGLTYKMVFTDWLTLDLNMKTYSVAQEFLENRKSTLNNEISFGINYIF